MGGKTKYGITEAVARKHGYTGKMIDLPIEKARDIYRKDYWDAYDLDDLSNHDVASYVFDMAVNHGGNGMTKILQRALSYRLPVAIDGRWGPETKEALTEMSRSYAANLLGALKVERGKFFMSIVEKNPSQRAFLWGWLKRCS